MQLNQDHCLIQELAVLDCPRHVRPGHQIRTTLHVKIWSRCRDKSKRLFKLVRTSPIRTRFTDTWRSDQRCRDKSRRLFMSVWDRPFRTANPDKNLKAFQYGMNVHAHIVGIKETDGFALQRELSRNNKLTFVVGTCWPERQY